MKLCYTTEDIFDDIDIVVRRHNSFILIDKIYIYESTVRSLQLKLYNYNTLYKVECSREWFRKNISIIGDISKNNKLFNLIAL